MTTEQPSEDVLRIVHAFGDKGRRDEVRKLAARVKANEDELARLRSALERLADGDTCDTASYADCCDRACVRIAREALAPSPSGGTATEGK